MEAKNFWEEKVNGRLAKIRDLFSRSYEDANFVYQFKINHVKPFGYTTEPIIADYDLFVDVTKVNKLTGESLVVELSQDIEVELEMLLLWSVIGKFY